MREETRAITTLTMIVHISRIILIVSGALSGLALSGLINWSEQTGFPEYFVIIILVILGSLIGYLFGGILGRELSLVMRRFEERLQDTAPTDIVLGALGLLLGLLAGVLVGTTVRDVQPKWVSFVSQSALLALFAYAGLGVALMKRKDIARAFPRLNNPAPSGEDASQRVFYLDTSAVIDARFRELALSGWLEGKLLVPRFVLAELHTLADSSEDVRRARGRRGLDLLETLRGDGTSIEVFEVDFPEFTDVDDKLMHLAAETRGTLVTVDHNLTKVARVRELGVLNLNELATALKPSFLPGETLLLLVSRVGKEPDQGVGYLDDGTMVVVQGGRELIGAEIQVEVTSVLQTSAGRMVFAKATGQ